VALNGCAQAAPERFGELPLLIGWIDIANIPGSTLRTFKGLSAEVLADGSDGGAAKLRVWGTDEWFWLVELELVKQAYVAGKPKQRSGPLGVKLALDYTLQPGSSALQVDLVAINDTATARELRWMTFLEDVRRRAMLMEGAQAAEQGALLGRILLAMRLEGDRSHDDMTCRVEQHFDAFTESEAAIPSPRKCAAWAPASKC